MSEETGSEILAKAEFMNPGGSVKDRAALFVVKDAEEKGLIKPGGTVVEGTAGNTGIGLAHVCRAKGYKCVIYMPNTQVRPFCSFFSHHKLSYRRNHAIVTRKN